MLIYTLKRLGLAVLVMLTVSLISFMLTRVSGDPAIAYYNWVGKALMYAAGH